jgi:hypothetical protein
MWLAIYLSHTFQHKHRDEEDSLHFHLYVCPIVTQLSELSKTSFKTCIWSPAQSLWCLHMLITIISFLIWTLKLPQQIVVDAHKNPISLKGLLMHSRIQPSLLGIQIVTVMLSAEHDNVPTTNLDSICSLVTEITSVYLERSA